MNKAIEATCTVHETGAPGTQIEESLRFNGKTVFVGNRKIKLADLQQAPGVRGDMVELVTKKLRVVTKSTVETRGLGASVNIAYRSQSAKGAGHPTPAKRPRGFQPTNTLNQLSRPAAARGGGGGSGAKRGKRMAAAAAAGGGTGGGRRLQREVAMGIGAGVVSSGRVSRRQDPDPDPDADLDDEVEEIEEPLGRRGGGREQLDDPGEGSGGTGSVKTTGTSSSNGSNAYRSSGSGGESIRPYLPSGSGGGGGGGGYKHAASLPGSRVRRAGRQGGIRDSWSGTGSSRPFPPLFHGPAAAGSGSGGTPGGIWRWARRLDHQYRVHREPVSRREGFRNMGNTCYLNACLQGLLSLSGFVGDLQRKCWVHAMLEPPPPPPPPPAGESGRDGGSETAIDIQDSPDPREKQPAEPGGGGGGGGKPILYDALLRLSLEAKGSHGLMDASPLKRAMDRHSDRFAGNLQQDAHEFLSDLINVLHDETHPRLDAAAAHVGKQAAAAVSVVAGPGAVEKTASAAAAARSGQGQGTGCLTLVSGEGAKSSITSGGGGDGGRNGGGGCGGRGDIGGDGAMMVDLRSGDEGSEGQESPDPYGGGGWDDDGDLAAAAAAAVDAAAAAGGGGHTAATAVEVLEVDSDSSGSDDDDDDDAGGTAAVSSSSTAALTKGPLDRDNGGTGTVGALQGRGGAEGREDVSEPAVVLPAEGGNEDGEGEGVGEEERGLVLRERERERERERLMPTTRHFHAEVEVTLTCTRCSYSRRRRELYRDFSLDIPDPAARQRQQQADTAGGGGGGGGGGGKGGASGLESLLEGFFQPSELNLRCERCGHDRVRAEHSLAELPGALVLHIKRFKPVMNNAAAAPTASANAKTTASSSSSPVVISSPPSAAKPRADTAAATAGDFGGDTSTTTPPAAVAVAGGESTGESSQRGGGGGGGGGGGSSYGGVSYVKLTAPVSVPLQLNLERFCSEFTGNAAPAQDQDLGESVDSLDGLAGIPSVSAPPALGAKTRRGMSTPAIAAGDKKLSSSDGISVDLSMREGWSSDGAMGRTAGDSGAAGSQAGDDPFRFPSPLLGTLREGVEEGAGSGAGAGAGKKLGGVLRNSTNGNNGGGSVRGVRETAAERRKRVLKEKENAASASTGRDRWSDQEGPGGDGGGGGRQHKHHTAAAAAGGVRLDSNRNIDYLATLMSGNGSNATGRGGAGVPGRGLFPLGGGERGGRLSSGGSGRLAGAGRAGFSSNVLWEADAVSASRLVQKRKRQQEIDDREQEEFAAAIAASQLETSALRGACQGLDVDDDDANLARAIHESMGQEEQERGKAGADEWVRQVCTLVDDGSSGASECVASSAPKPELPPCAPAADAGGVDRARGKGMAAGGGGGGGGEDGREKDTVILEGDGKQTGGEALPSSSTAGGSGTQDHRSKQQQQQQQQQHMELDQKSEEERVEDDDGDEGEGRDGSPATPESQPRVAREGPLRARYELRGILHHLGQHAFAGHYVTDVRQAESTGSGGGGGGGGVGEKSSAGKGSGPKGTGWKRHDDSVVAAVSEAKALDGAAQRTCYICFYSLVAG